MTLTLLVVYGLATHRAVATWFHGSLFAAARSRSEARREAAALAGRPAPFWDRLLACPLCLAHWPPVMLLAAGAPCWAWVHFVGGGPGAQYFAFHAPAFSLAATDVALLFLWGSDRTPRRRPPR